MKNKIGFSLTGFVLLLTAAAAFSGTYYCVSGNHTYIGGEDMNCESWNSDFWKKNDPGKYNECLKEKQTVRQMIRQGKCDVATSKAYSYGGKNCVFSVIEAKKKIIAVYCDSVGGTRDVEKQFMSQYGYSY